MNVIYYLMAFAAGLGITLQTTLNAQLAKGIGGDPVAAALFSFTVGAVCVGVYSLVWGEIIPSLIAISTQPWWSLLGGILGSCALLSYVILAPRIGLSALLGLAIAGQILSSLMIDHFGLLGATERPVSLIKLVGTIVMLVGLTVALLGDKLSEIF
ncbi:DMT family transporter [Acinetobacter soli]|uniref:DMT family transporter n=1 Tax=Acinetobacter soli TaxID=487316 RepID=UPI00124FF1BC|nr:DMT family transporter [Acinetobacter soli]WEH92783.1 DMT family transporter [Acinetobacter soli]WEH98031.1 DMT family transporter [Acinetobacter soli]WEI01391.1 DMT family transporter [Acinetobacter soli]